MKLVLFILLLRYPMIKSFKLAQLIVNDMSTGSIIKMNDTPTERSNYKRVTDEDTLDIIPEIKDIENSEDIEDIENIEYIEDIEDIDNIGDIEEIKDIEAFADDSTYSPVAIMSIDPDGRVNCNIVNSL